MKYYGDIGYAETVETAPGVYREEFTKRSYFGDILRNSRQLQSSEHLNGNIRVSNKISIVADPYANEHYFAMRYAEWMGSLWTITDVEVQRPRLILTLGEVYRGQTT